MDVRISYTPQHLCYTCKFVSKCDRLSKVLDVLLGMEKEAFREWKINLTTSLRIDECPLYKTDFELVQTMGDFYDGLNDEGEDGFE